MIENYLNSGASSNGISQFNSTNNKFQISGIPLDLDDEMPTRPLLRNSLNFIESGINRTSPILQTRPNNILISRLNPLLSSNRSSISISSSNIQSLITTSNSTLSSLNAGPSTETFSSSRSSGPPTHTHTHTQQSSELNYSGVLNYSSINDHDHRDTPRNDHRDTQTTLYVPNIQGAQPESKSGFHCSFCGRAFISKKSYASHLVSHQTDKPYACKKCEKKFARKSDLTRHEKLHVEKANYVCERCGRTFSRADVLKRHLNMTPKASSAYCTPFILLGAEATANRDASRRPGNSSGLDSYGDGCSSDANDPVHPNPVNNFTNDDYLNHQQALDSFRRYFGATVPDEKAATGRFSPKMDTAGAGPNQSGVIALPEGMAVKTKNVPEELKSFLQENSTQWFTNEQLAEQLNHTSSGIRNAVTKLKGTNLIQTHIVGSLAYRAWHTTTLDSLQLSCHHSASHQATGDITSKKCAGTIGRSCNGCGTTNSRYWRSDLEEKNMWLCNNCGMNQRRGRGVHRPLNAYDLSSNLSQEDLNLNFNVGVDMIAPAAEHATAPDDHEQDDTFYPSNGYVPAKPSVGTKRKPPHASYVDPSKRKCGHCDTTKSAGKWRRDREVPDRYLCNKCGMNQRRTQMRLELQLQQKQKLLNQPLADPTSTATPLLTREGRTTTSLPCSMCQERLVSFVADCSHRMCGECVPDLIKQSGDLGMVGCPLCPINASLIPVEILGEFVDSIIAC